tara:strand:+ start:468 stop:1457 length:990 start_codon:yes stop_codon:yes gene_type:complete
MIVTSETTDSVGFLDRFARVGENWDYVSLDKDQCAYLISQFPEVEKELFIFEGENGDLGRILLTQSAENQGVCFFGMVDYIHTENNVSKELYKAIMNKAKEWGAKKVIGPVNINTWFGNRFKSSGFNNQYGWEPNNPEAYINDAMDFGFEVDHSYSSKFFEAMELQAARSKMGYEMAINKGFSFRCPDLNSEEDILRLYELNTTSFKNNYLYEPITLDQYKATYIQVLKGSDLSLSFFILDKNLVPRGYVYNFLEGDCLIIKSILVEQSYQGGLLSSALIHETAKKSLERGITKGAGVLIREGNISSKFYEKIGEPYQIHEYKMLKKEL